MSYRLSPPSFLRIKRCPKLRWTFFLTDIWKEVPVLSLCLDRSYQKITLTVRCFFHWRAVFGRHTTNLDSKPQANILIHDQLV